MATSMGGETPREGRVRNAILIAGPTASGKSAMALDIAEKHNGIIINTDSMQVYAGLPILTAAPAASDLDRVPHRLYGHVDPARVYSTAIWLHDVRDLLNGGLEGRRPVFVGGTGLYFKALTEGISDMPDIPASIRDKWRYHLLEDGAARLHDELSRRDPVVAARLKRNDAQRILRALEVIDASGRSILDWQSNRAEPLVDLASARAAVLDVPREVLIARIDGRLEAMVEAGALEEVRALMSRRLSEANPAMKAIGVREFAAVLENRLKLEEAIEQAKIATRQYSKRQSTWFRNQFDDRWKRVDPEVLRARS